MIKGEIVASGYLATIFNTCHSLQQFSYVGREKSLAASQDSDIIGEIDVAARNARPFYLTHLYLDFNFKSDIGVLLVILANSPSLKYLTLYSEDKHTEQKILKTIRLGCKCLSSFIYHRRHRVIRHGKRNEFRFTSERLIFSYRVALSTILKDDDEHDNNDNSNILSRRRLPHQEENQQQQQQQQQE